MKIPTITSLLALACSGAFACSGDNVVDRTLDCHNICERYNDCFDDEYDVGECRDNCEDEADNDPEFEDKVDACDECIDDQSCTEGAFDCATQCTGIVP